MNIAFIPQPLKIDYLDGTVGIDCEVKGQYDEDVVDEGYKMYIDNDILIKASSKSGFFYAHQTLNQIKYQCDKVIPKMIIMDRPRYSYRAFMLDSCRHFFTVEEIKNFIKICSELKFNKFHWHLSEDQGWRAEIKKYPALTQVGSIRHGSNFGQEKNTNDYGGYYTKEQMREIVLYANNYFIDVIPEIDVPGHASALIASIPELSCNGSSVEIPTKEGIYKNLICAGKDSTLKIVFDIIDELCEVFTDEYFHIGGDEAPKNNWKVCTDCQQKIAELNLKDEEQLQGWFVNTVSDYLKSKGKKAIGWNESLKGDNLNKDITVQFWMDKKGLCKNSDNPLIISDFWSYYMDYPYAMTPMKKVYNYNPQINSNVIGIEAPVWTEFISDYKKIEYMCFPRYFAVAQTAWCENKPEYSFFEKDLKTLWNMYPNQNWALEKEWNMNPFSRLGKTIKHYSTILNKDMVKSFLFPEK